MGASSSASSSSRALDVDDDVDGVITVRFARDGGNDASNGRTGVEMNVASVTKSDKKRSNANANGWRSSRRDDERTRGV